jgi:DNA-binding NtrC family response regulator
VNGCDPFSRSILLVDDEEEILFTSKLLLRSAGFSNVFTLDDSRQVPAFLENRETALVVLDLYMPHISGTELLSEITYSHPQVPVIVMTAANEINLAIECMKRGASDYLVKPVERDRFLLSVKKALEVTALQKEVSSLTQSLLTNRLKHPETFAPIVTKSKKMRVIFQYIEAISGSAHPVLITGETGVGKELIARSIHALSGRKGNFVAVNVAGLDDNVFSDTLFGHRKGAYTGADSAREGLLARAEAGTLFLDEIGDTSGASQVKLLRFLQEGEYYPLGSDLPRRSDARVIVATNHDIFGMIGAGTFRNDLFYRLRTHHIHVPSLRERPEDIPVLLDHFLGEAAASLKKWRPSYPPELVTLLSSHHFPGNVRELQTLVFDAMARHGRGVLSMESFKEGVVPDLSQGKTGNLPDSGDGLSLETGGRMPTLKEAEDYLVSEALRRAGENQGVAASLLGISRQALNKRLTRKNKS